MYRNRNRNRNRNKIINTQTKLQFQSYKEYLYNEIKRIQNEIKIDEQKMINLSNIRFELLFKTKKNFEEIYILTNNKILDSKTNLEIISLLLIKSNLVNEKFKNYNEIEELNKNLEYKWNELKNLQLLYKLQ